MISWPDLTAPNQLLSDLGHVWPGPCVARPAQTKIRMPKNGRSWHGTARPGNRNVRSVSGHVTHV